MVLSAERLTIGVSELASLHTLVMNDHQIAMLACDLDDFLKLGIEAKDWNILAEARMNPEIRVSNQQALTKRRISSVSLAEPIDCRISTAASMGNPGN